MSATQGAELARLLDVAMQWVHTARLTGSPRHHDTALTCARIALEHAGLIGGSAPGPAEARTLYGTALAAQMAATEALLGKLLMQMHRILDQDHAPEQAALENDRMD